MLPLPLAGSRWIYEAAKTALHFTTKPLLEARGVTSGGKTGGALKGGGCLRTGIAAFSEMEAYLTKGAGLTMTPRTGGGSLPATRGGAKVGDVGGGDVMGTQIWLETGLVPG